MVSFENMKNEYERNWANLEIRPTRLGDANAVARKAITGKATYQQIERLTGVPWYFAAPRTFCWTSNRKRVNPFTSTWTNTSSRTT